MAATASASSSGPRYAPEDPTLPKPWRGLVDGNTGYLYYWNPETDVTQYERPVANSLPGPPLPPPPPLPPKSTSVPISSSVQIQHSSGSTSQGHHRHNSKEDTGHHNVNINNGPKLAAIPGPRSHQSSGSSAQGHHHHHSKEDAGHRNVNNNNGPKLAAIPGARSHQGSRGSSSHIQNVPNGSVNAGHGTAKVHDHGSGSQTLRSSSRVHGSEAGGGSSVESYRRQHEITVSGVDVPAPFMTFESTGFPSEILREVRYSLQRGANVVRCAAVVPPSLGGMHIVGAP